MNKLYVGFTKKIELPEGGCLLIDDEVQDVPRARVFDPKKHSFNPLKNLDYKKAREIAEILYTASPEGENTLTVRNGKRALLKILLEGKERLDRLRGGKEPGAIEAMETVDDVLMSPVLKRVLCNPTNFSFKPTSTILARVNRAELGEHDALLLGLFLMAHFKGQVVVPDFGFYGRQVHMGLIREGRLIAGVNSLAELPARLRQGVLVIKDKVASGATVEDAKTLAEYERLVPGTNGFNDFVASAVA
jgi:hypothetical protein